MPVYEYLCPRHGVFERRNAIDRAGDPQKCGACGTESPRTFFTPPAVPDPAGDRMFNYGQGYFDVGAGRWFNTRGQRSRWMEERGLRPIEDGADAFVERGGKKASKIKVDKAAVKDAYEQGQARLRQGWRPMKQQEANAIQKELSSG